MGVLKSKLLDRKRAEDAAKMDVCAGRRGRLVG